MLKILGEEPHAVRNYSFLPFPTPVRFILFIFLMIQSMTGNRLKKYSLKTVVIGDRGHILIRLYGFQLYRVT